jgi:MraZ protein
MRIFSSNSTHKIDAKGRVSIPASFRKVLEREEQPGVILIPLMRAEPAIEGMGYGRFEQLAEAIDAMNPLDPGAVALSYRIMGEARHLPLDETGRIVLGPDLRDTIGLTDEAVFVGVGKHFQIWEPKAWAARQPGIARDSQAAMPRLPWSSAPAARPEPAP